MTTYPVVSPSSSVSSSAFLLIHSKSWIRLELISPWEQHGRQVTDSNESIGAASARPTKQESSSASRYPTIVRDIRYLVLTEVTRLVFDLNRTAAYSQHIHSNPDRVTIEVKNTILGKSSRLRVSGGTIPRPFMVSQSHPRTVAITLQPNPLNKYKVFALANPDRLVVDVYHRPQDQFRQIGDVTRPSTATVAATTAPPRL